MSSITTSVPNPPPMVQAPVFPGARPLPGAGQGPTLTPQDVIRILKRYVFLIIAVFIVFFSLSIAGTVMWAKFYPRYVSTALIEVLPPIPPPVMGQETRVVAKDIIEQAMNTQAARIRSQATLQKVLGDPMVRQTSWFQSFQTEGGTVDVDAALLDIQRRLSAGPMRDSNLVMASFSWRHPKEASDILDVALRTYLDDVSFESQRKTRGELGQYQERQKGLRDRLQKEVGEQERFRTTNNIPLIEQRRTGIGDQVMVLTQLLAQSLTVKDHAQGMFEMYNQPGAMEQMAETPEMRQLVNADPFVRYYTQSLADLRITLSATRERGSRNRTVHDLETRMALVEKELNERKRQVMSDTYRDMRERTRVELDTSNMQVIGLQNRLAEARMELSELEKQLATYLAREQEIAILQEQLRAIEDYVLTLQIQIDNPELIRVKKPFPAITPLRRSSPSLVVNTFGGFVVSLMLGVGLAFMIEFMSTTVKTPADVLRQLSMPLLGQIPSQDEEDYTPEELNRMLLDSPHSMLAESFRQLRANFLFCAPAEHQRSILITSCSPSEGKTSVAANLATSLALAGRKILLVDANFRRPDQAQAFGLTGLNEGLSNILIGHPDPESLIHRTRYENLDLLASGPLPPNPAELLSGRHLKDFIARFNGTYQTIIFDGPPVLVVSDAMILATAMDGVVLVIRAGTSARGAVMRARDQLKRASARILGAVLNDVKITRGGYFREMYKTYYEYHSTESLPEDTESDSDAGKGEPDSKATT